MAKKGLLHRAPQYQSEYPVLTPSPWYSVAPIDYAGREIPFGIILIIFDEISFDSNHQLFKNYQKDLFRLSLVCRAFQSLAIRKLSKEIRLTGSHGKNCGKSFGAELMERALEGDASACDSLKEVRFFTLLGGRFMGRDWWDGPRQKHYLSTHLPSLCSLVSVKIARTILDEDATRVLYQLTNLETLTIRRCTFSPSTNSQHFVISEHPSRLREFHLIWNKSLDDFYRNDMLNFLATDTLRVLTITDTNLARLFITRNEDIVPLEHLDICIRRCDGTVLSSFLTRCLDLAELKITIGEVPVSNEEADKARANRVVYTDWEIDFDLPPSSLPKLEIFHCPYVIYRQLQLYKDITVFDLVADRDWMLAYDHDRYTNSFGSNKWISRAKELVIPLGLVRHRDVFPSLMEVCQPETLVLGISIQLSHPAARLDHIVWFFNRSQGTYPDIHTIKFLTHKGFVYPWALDLALQEAVIRTQLVSIFLSVTRISFYEGLEWRLNPETKEWIPVIQAPELYRTLLDATPDDFSTTILKVRDFRGLLGSLDEGRVLREEIVINRSNETM